MKIRLILSLVLALLLISIILNASDQASQDSLPTSAQDSTQSVKPDSSWSKDFLNWVEEHQGLLEFLGLIIAISTTIFAIIAWFNKRKKKKLKD